MLYLKSKTMPKSKPILTPHPAYYPFVVYHNPHPVQPRLMPQRIFIHRDTAFPRDVQYARAAIQHALYQHCEIVLVETWWHDLPHTLKRWCVKEGARIVLCGSVKEAWNSSDIRWVA
jgi:hypothetical protein